MEFGEGDVHGCEAAPEELGGCVRSLDDNGREILLENSEDCFLLEKNITLE